MKKEEKIKVGISVGDLNGIGTEVILKTFKDNRMLELCTPVIFGSTKILSFQKKHFNIQANFHGISSAENAQHGKINVVNITKDPITIEYGKPTEEAGRFAIKSFVEATKALKEGTIDVLVTAPINKHNVQSEEFTFPGHTDYLGQTLEGDSLMLMVNNTLRVGAFRKIRAGHKTHQKVGIFRGRELDIDAGLFADPAQEFRKEHLISVRAFADHRHLHLAFETHKVRA